MIIRKINSNPFGSHRRDFDIPADRDEKMYWQCKSIDDPQVPAFWHWAIEQGQTCLERMGLACEPNCDEVLQHVATFPIKDGIYVDSQGRPLRLPAILGSMPPFKAITLGTATRTYAKTNEMKSQSSGGTFGSSWAGEFQ